MSLEQYFRAMGILDKAVKVENKTLYLADTVMVWWRRCYVDMEKGLGTIATWGDFKKELKR